jgi:hypothetical protein
VIAPEQRGAGRADGPAIGPAADVFGLSTSFGPGLDWMRAGRAATLTVRPVGLA